jgi:hypothetical protein
MPTSLFQYEMLPTTWFYMSAIILLAIFFKFNRVWSVRNFDLICLILLTPGLLLLAGWDNETGYTWLFCIQGMLAVRLILDTVMVRRPLLEPNLSAEGLTFSCFFLVFFLFAALIINRGEEIKTVHTVRLEQILTTRHIHEGKISVKPNTPTIPQSEWSNMPPGFRPFLVLTARANLAFAPPSHIQQAITGEIDHPDTPPLTIHTVDGIIMPTTDPITLKASAPPTESASLHPELRLWLLILTFVITGHLVIVLEFAYIGYRHFGKLQTGIACAALYLFHPYSTQIIGRLDHVIPAALLLGSVALYRRPFFAGLGIGTAAALVWYPLWLLPLWCGFYRHKGWMRFLFGTVSALLAFAAMLWFSLPEWGTLNEQLIHMAGKTALMIFSQQPDGFWAYDDMFYRMPVLAVFVVICFGLFLVPSHKHLATLIGGSALIMIGVQFFQLHQGGLYLSWYLPFLILTIFRPNLEDRTARTVVL